MRFPIFCLIVGCLLHSFDFVAVPYLNWAASCAFGLALGWLLAEEVGTTRLRGRIRELELFDE